MIYKLRGWDIYCDVNAPVTGRWKAMRFGVRICANTKDMMIDMINNRPY